MKKQTPVWTDDNLSFRGLLTRGAVLLVLLLILVCAVPRFLRYKPMNSLYGIVDPQTGAPVTMIPLGSGDVDVGLISRVLQTFPKTTLLLNGEPSGEIVPGEWTRVHFGADWFETPGTIVVTLVHEPFPGIRVYSNDALIGVE